jgi:5'-deoxynucleotidase YfbR-like HD superfamily hydrolase
MSEELPPALTKQEWAVLERAGRNHSSDEVESLITRLRHLKRYRALAIALLHDYPYGFTRDMYDALKRQVAAAEGAAGDRELAEQALERMAALLPPEPAPVEAVGISIAT